MTDRRPALPAFWKPCRKLTSAQLSSNVAPTRADTLISRVTWFRSATNLATNATSEFSQTSASAAALVVTTTNDVVDGNTSSIANLLGNKGADGFISLREAIIATNLRGAQVLTSYEPIEQLKWTVLVDEPLAFLDESRTRLIARLAAVELKRCQNCTRLDWSTWH